MTFFGYMSRVREQLASAGVEALVPDAEDHLLESASPRQFDELRRAFAMNHIKRIRNPRTFAVLVLNFDKHGIENYIGPSTFAEIAVAAVHGKKLFVLNGFPTVYEDELALWRAERLHGRLDQLIALYRERCSRRTFQLDMFAA
jgi:hypothetical protein